ncbi:hypothetical protein K470DRAFT_216225 [Piedraia hortae CBS 480.64]|uniref:DUF2470 domain-containing protein n=1 Tax=Piedraia hortae CBS 480.64 TaxID=1314780 RepID=A0A6A7BZZ4_9PEZI|nr:hypothetical protein K470DRAFT_216225 [Piedraia hortae CBS 480.64]
MADQGADNAVARNRIVLHMNKDHHDSIVRYLQHRFNLSPWQAYDGRLSGIHLNGLAIVCHGKTYHIHFDPPLTNYKEARGRVIQLDQEARQALGQSDIDIKEYIPPRGLYALECALLFVMYAAYCQRWWFARGSVVERYLGAGFATWSWWIQPRFVPVTMLAHFIETIIYMRTKLLKHSINPRTSLFWLWSLTFIFEGVFGKLRFDGLVRRKMAEKAKQK